MTSHPLYRYLNPRFIHQLRWRWSLSEELKYWRHWMETQGDEWPEDYKMRLNPHSEISNQLQPYLSPQKDKDLLILDVGAGPISGIGFVLPGENIKITATDPLAKKYNKLLKRFKIKPPLWTQQCHAEALGKRFPKNHFDLVHCRNALDHSYNPFEAIQHMLLVAKPGGTVVLDHYANEAQFLSYQGLHQWNFDIQQGKLVLWSRWLTINVTDELSDTATIECQLKELGRKWVFCTLKKKITRENSDVSPSSRK